MLLKRRGGSRKRGEGAGGGDFWDVKQPKGGEDRRFVPGDCVPNVLLMCSLTDRRIVPDECVPVVIYIPMCTDYIHIYTDVHRCVPNVFLMCS